MDQFVPDKRPVSEKVNGKVLDVVEVKATDCENTPPETSMVPESGVVV
jgi:hypothetical protein